MAAVLPDLSVTISQRRWSCVLDPTLALSHYGLPLVTRLREVMEVWVARELWNILDNTHFYLQEPGSLVPRGAGHEIRPQDREAILSALRGWEQIRMETDPGGLGICWVGDSPSESFLPEHQDPAIVWRYEHLSASLDRRVTHPGMLTSAFRDTIALAVAEGRALILSHLPEHDAAERPPAICGALGEWGISCRIVEADDPLSILERDCVRRLLVQAGVARLCWAGLRLVALHVVAPLAAALYRLSTDDFNFPGEGGHPEADITSPAPETGDAWQGAQGFWYPF